MRGCRTNNWWVLSLATYAVHKLLRKPLSDQHDTIFFKNIQSASSSELQEEITAVRTHLPLPYHFKHTPRALVENSQSSEELLFFT
jgi:hypothetical protein